MVLHLYLFFIAAIFNPCTVQQDLPQKSVDHFIQPCGKIPILNKTVIDYVKAHLNKKVGRGECWDLAAEALNTAGANWDKNFKFGSLINFKTDCVYPGDVIQFTDVSVDYTEGNRTYSETMAQHTAIIFEIKASGDYILADQNTTASAKKVGLRSFNVQHITKGKFQIFRPVK